MDLTTLTWLIPVPPLLAFLLILLLFRKSKTISWMLAWAAIGTSLVLGWTVAFNVFSKGYKELKQNPLVVGGTEDSSFVWMPFGKYTANACERCLEMGVSVDPLTAIMLFMVPLAVAMIFMYSVGYHNFGQPKGTHLGEPNHGKEEPLFSRFFAFMCLFAAGMLTLIVSDNLLLLFVGWEVMGLCSYLLIGFWYARQYDFDPKNPQKLPPRKASIKAFMTTRIADVVMLMGIVFFFRVFGTLRFSEALSAESLINAYQNEYFGLSGGVAIAVMALLIFTGTVGKSAQWPLHVWLPNAMEGPTPVSAVIHAAAMVSAGIYLLLRIFPLIAVGTQAWPTAGWIIGGIGAFTALMAATIAIAQDDVKGVLAYSTISQLGFMVAAIGMGAYIAAAFHLITHAFFKALLFLSSGSVIHGMEHGAEHVHDHHTDPQDMMNMGGLKDKMPITYMGFLLGGLALSGFPIVTAGFWSKDEIFADAWLLGSHGNTLAMTIFVTLCIAAFLTAFYTARQLCLTFLGKPRTPLAEHAHESNRFMTTPLIVLSFFAVTAGWVGIPTDFPILGEIVGKNYFHDYAAGTIYETINTLVDTPADALDSHDMELKEDSASHKLALAENADDAHASDSHGNGLVAHGLEAPPVTAVPLAASLIVALGGLFCGWLLYGFRPLKEGQEDPLKTYLGPIHTFLMNKWYWDELYQFVFIKPVKYFSEVIVYEWFDRGLIDGIIHFVANGFLAFGRIFRAIEDVVFGVVIESLKDGFLWLSRELRSVQSGNIQQYTLVSTLLITVIAFAVLAFQIYG